MGKIRKILNEEKKNMPGYQYTFLYKKVLPGFLYILCSAIVLVILCPILDRVTDFSPLLLILPGVWLASVAVLLVLFVCGSKKLSRRLLRDKTAEFSEKFRMIDPKTAESNLEEAGILRDGMLLWKGETIALSECTIFFYCRTHAGKFFFQLLFLSRMAGEPPVLDLDENSYTYFATHSERIANAPLFELFVQDKELFLKSLFRYNDPEKMLQKLQKMQKDARSTAKTND